MKTIVTMMVTGLVLASPAHARGGQAPRPPANFSGLFTTWNSVSRDSVRAEIEARVPPSGAVPASSDNGRSRSQAVALGERVAEAVRRGDCAEGERIARDAGDFPLVRAVRDYCRTRS